MPGSNGYGSPHTIEKHLALKNGIEDLTLTGNLTLDLSYGNRLRIDPGGNNRDVTLPAHTGNNGVWFDIVNTADAVENLVIKDSAGSTVVTLNQNERVHVQSNGSAWKHMGVQTIAQS